MIITMPAVSNKKGRMGENSSQRSDAFLPAINSRGSTTASESDGSPVAPYHTPEMSHRSLEMSAFRLPNIDDRSKNVSAASDSSMTFHFPRSKERNVSRDNHRNSTHSSFVTSVYDSDSDVENSTGKENGNTHNIETRLPNIFKSAAQKQEGTIESDREFHVRKSEKSVHSVERGRTYIALLDRLDRTPRAELTGNLYATPRANVTPSTPHQAALLLPMRHDEPRPQGKKKRKQDSSRTKTKKEHSEVKDSCVNKSPTSAGSHSNGAAPESVNDEAVLKSHHGVKVKMSPKQQNYNNILKDKDTSPRSAAPHIRA